MTPLKNYLDTQRRMYVLREQGMERDHPRMNILRKQLEAFRKEATKGGMAALLRRVEKHEEVE